MAARTVQINSFCGGSSRLLDSEFLGMEESLNMYPETVTATDTYTTKMLKGVEGFNQGSLYSQERFSGFGVVNSNPFGNDSINESVLVVAQGDDYNIYNTYGGTKTKVGMFTAPGVGTHSIIEEMPNGLAIVLCGYKLVVKALQEAERLRLESEKFRADLIEKLGKSINNTLTNKLNAPGVAV